LEAFFLRVVLFYSSQSEIETQPFWHGFDFISTSLNASAQPPLSCVEQSRNTYKNSSLSAVETHPFWHGFDFISTLLNASAQPPLSCVERNRNVYKQLVERSRNASFLAWLRLHFEKMYR